MNIIILGISLEAFVLYFFFLSFLGWIFELFLEWLAGRGFVNRGFFYGPIVPIYAVGCLFAFALTLPFKNYPALVFFISAAACTLLEYFAGFLLEKFLNVRAWDYDIHPLTFWCNYKKRISLMATLSFGCMTLIFVYLIWDNMNIVFDKIGNNIIRTIDIVFLIIFALDAFFSFRKYIINKKNGNFSITRGLENIENDAEINKYFLNVAREIIYHEKFQESKKYIQHGKTSIYTHCVATAKMCAKFSVFWKVKDRDSLIRAALLHDFFLYDWHDEWKLGHGFTHPVEAAKNAKRFFNITDKEYSLIRTHMWPWTLFHPPHYKEGWILCLSDKIVSVNEIVRRAWKFVRRR